MAAGCKLWVNHCRLLAQKALLLGPSKATTCAPGGNLKKKETKRNQQSQQPPETPERKAATLHHGSYPFGRLGSIKAFWGASMFAVKPSPNLGKKIRPTRAAPAPPASLSGGRAGHVAGLDPAPIPGVVLDLVVTLQTWRQVTRITGKE